MGGHKVVRLKDVLLRTAHCALHTYSVQRTACQHASVPACVPTANGPPTLPQSGSPGSLLRSLLDTWVHKPAGSGTWLGSGIILWRTNDDIGQIQTPASPKPVPASSKLKTT